MTFGPEKVQERLTRKPPPGRLLQHTPRRQPLVHFIFNRGVFRLFWWWNFMECEKHSIAIRHGFHWKKKKGKECRESELCDLKPSCTLRIVQCRIPSMQPFNDTFSALCPVISCSPSPKLPPKSWHWRDIQRMLLVNDTFTSECSLSLRKNFWLCMLCLFSLSQEDNLCFLQGSIVLPLGKAYCFLSFVFPSILSKVYWTIPVEAAKKLEIPKSVEMPKESMRKSVFVESLKHSVIPPTNIDRTLGRKTLIWRIPGRHKKWHVRNIYEWGQGDFEEAAMHPTKKESEDKLTLQEGPIKITPLKIYACQWWLNEKESCTWLTLIIERSPLKILSWLIWVLSLYHLSV